MFVTLAEAGSVSGGGAGTDAVEVIAGDSGVETTLWRPHQKPSSPIQAEVPHNTKTFRQRRLGRQGGS